MGKFFPKLTQTQVFIQTGGTDGEGFNCPMLPVGKLAEMNEISEALAKGKSIADFEALRLRLIALVKTVIPTEYHDSLNRLDIPRLAELAAYLMYGDPENDDQPRPAAKN